LFFQFGITIPTKFSVGETRHWSKPYLKWLEELEVPYANIKQVLDNYLTIGKELRNQLLVINKQIRKLSQTERYIEDYKLITSIPGMGLIAGMNFLLELDDINRFEVLDQLNSYVGMVPNMHGSGDRMTVGKMTKRGRKILKIMLIEASWIAVRHDPALLLKFNELTKTMPKNKAIIRIARKMLNRMRTVLKNKTPYILGVEE
jgi:transposase